MENTNTVWLRQPHGVGDPREFEAKPEVLVPLMVAGWTQCGPPTVTEETKQNVHD